MNASTSASLRQRSSTEKDTTTKTEQWMEQFWMHPITMIWGECAWGSVAFTSTWELRLGKNTQRLINSFACTTYTIRRALQHKPAITPNSTCPNSTWHVSTADSAVQYGGSTISSGARASHVASFFQSCLFLFSQPNERSLCLLEVERAEPRFDVGNSININSPDQGKPSENEWTGRRGTN